MEFPPSPGARLRRGIARRGLVSCLRRGMMVLRFFTVFRAENSLGSHRRPLTFRGGPVSVVFNFRGLSYSTRDGFLWPYLAFRAFDFYVLPWFGWFYFDGVSSLPSCLPSRLAHVMVVAYSLLARLGGPDFLGRRVLDLVVRPPFFLHSKVRPKMALLFALCAVLSLSFFRERRVFLAPFLPPPITLAVPRAYFLFPDVDRRREFSL